MRHGGAHIRFTTTVVVAQSMTGSCSRGSETLAYPTRFPMTKCRGRHGCDRGSDIGSVPGGGGFRGMLEVFDGTAHHSDPVSEIMFRGMRVGGLDGIRGSQVPRSVPCLAVLLWVVLAVCLE